MLHLKQYRDKVQKCVKQISCPVCGQVMPVKLWTQHACSGNKRNACPWCFGKVVFKKGEKVENLPHLRQCFSNFVKRNAFKKRPKTASSSAAAAAAPPPPSPAHFLAVSNRGLEPSCPPCTEFYLRQPRPLVPKRAMLGRERLEGADPRFYESLFETVPEWLEVPPPPPPPPLVNSSSSSSSSSELRLILKNGDCLKNEMSGLSGALVWIQRFWVFRRYGWYHVMVRAGTMGSFWDALSDYSEDVCVLPYWCLCDGQSSETKKKKKQKKQDPLYVHHRHMILVTRLSACRFEKAVWNRVLGGAAAAAAAADVLVEGGSDKYKLKRRIRDARHFCNALCYVSLAKSKCRGGFVGGEKDEEEGRVVVVVEGGDTVYRHHYHMTHPVVDHAIHFLLRTFPGGQDAWVTQTLGPRIRGLRSVVEKRRDPNGNYKYYVRPTDACPKVTRCPVPVAKNLQFLPPDRDIPLERALGMDELPEFYLFSGKGLMPLEREDALLDLSTGEWLAYQVSHHNAFMERVADDWVAVGRRQQVFLREMERELEDKEREFERAMDARDREFQRAVEARDGLLEDKERLLEDKDRLLEDKERLLEEKDSLLEEKKSEFKRRMESNDRELKVKEGELEEERAWRDKTDKLWKKERKWRVKTDARLKKLQGKEEQWRKLCLGK